MEKPNMYHKSKIYKIVNDVNDDIYIGSTVKQLSNRMAVHRSTAKIHPDRRIYITINEIGIEHFKIILVESFQCENKEELRAREDYYIQLFKPALNMISAIFNIDKKKDNMKDYRNENKEILKKNRDQKKDTKSKYNKEYNTILYHCDCCDIDLTIGNKSKHNKTKKHISNLNKKITI